MIKARDIIIIKTEGSVFFFKKNQGYFSDGFQFTLNSVLVHIGERY